MVKRVALVEDEPTIRANYADALTRQGYEVSTHAEKDEALVACLTSTASEAEIESETVGVVEDDGYFLVCSECEERTPRRYMHDGRICQGCAEANHGVVY